MLYAAAVWRGKRQHLEFDCASRQLRRAGIWPTFTKSCAGKKNWRDLIPTETNSGSTRAVHDLVPNCFTTACLAANAQSRFAARALAASLQDYIVATVGWME